MKKLLLSLLILTCLIVSASAEQKIYYHYVDLYDYSDGSRVTKNIPHDVIKFLKEGWKITHISATAGDYSRSVIVYILEKEDK